MHAWWSTPILLFYFFIPAVETRRCVCQECYLSFTTLQYVSLRPESNRVIQITNLAHRLQCLRGLFYFLLLCLRQEPANDFVVLPVFLLLNAFAAFLATFLPVRGAFAMVRSLLFVLQM